MVNTTGFGSRLLRGLILAAGDGRRLQPYVRQLRGEELPKQYVNFVGQRSMLEQTFHRAEMLIPADQIFAVVSRRHLVHAEVRRQLAGRPRETLIVQPANKETGPGILLPLMFIYKRCPEAIIALFPSDHFILEEDRFMKHVNRAIQAVEHDPARIVLLAIEPHEPETEYGYVVPHGRLCRFGTRPVSLFIEKPRAELAAELVMAGGLWNTMTMAFKLDTFLELVRRVHPTLYLNFCRILEAVGTAGEQRRVDNVYEMLEPVNFSKEIMERIADRYPKSVSVLPVRKVYWSDLGSPDRVLQVFTKLAQPKAEAIQPESNFLKKWENRQGKTPSGLYPGQRRLGLSIGKEP